MTAATTSRLAPRTTAIALALGVAVAALATSAVAFLAVAFGANPAFAPLNPPAFLTFAIAGTLAGVAGWVLVVRFVRRSARLLRVLVPVLVALTWIPDVVLLFTGFIPGATPVGVVGLMLMHPIVAAVAVAVGQRVAPAK